MAQLQERICIEGMRCDQNFIYRKFNIMGLGES